VKRLNWFVTLFAVSLMAIANGSAALAAREAAPDAPGGLTGYPELRITANATGFELPARVTAGRTLITLDNRSPEVVPAHMLLVPDETTVADLQAFVESDQPPAWFDRRVNVFTGFPGEAAPGDRSQAIVDLAPGHYGILAPPMYALFEAVPSTDATPSASAEPAADGTVTLTEFSFDLPEPVTAGRHLWKVTNAGRQIHHLVLAKAPRPVTLDQVMAMLMLPEDAAPPPGVPAMAEYGRAGGIGFMTPGQTAWTLVALEPGTYVALCAAFDEETGAIHVMMGMVTIFTVV
jgi:hypothetical protein